MSYFFLMGFSVFLEVPKIKNYWSHLLPCYLSKLVIKNNNLNNCLHSTLENNNNNKNNRMKIFVNPFICAPKLNQERGRENEEGGRRIGSSKY